MKKIALTLLIVAVILLGMSYIAGGFVEGSYRELTTDLSDFVLEESYERGWLGSTVSATYEVPAQSASDEPLRVHVEHDMVHGPLPVAEWVRGNLRLRPLRTIVRSRIRIGGENSPLLPPISVETEAPFGSIHVEASMPAGEISADGDRLTHEGFRATTTVDESNGWLHSEVAIPLLAVTEDGQSSHIRSIRVDADYERTAENLWLGTTTISVADVSSFDTRLQDMEIVFSSGLDGDRMHVESRGNVARVVIRNVEYGPAKYEAAARRLDVQAVQALREAAAEMEAAAAATAAEQLVVLTDSLVALARQSPRFELESLHVETPDGALEIQAAAEIAAEGLDAITNPILLLGALRAEAAVAAPEALLHAFLAANLAQRIAASEQGQGRSREEIAAIAETMARKQIEALREQGILERDGKRYRVRARWTNGQLFVNGRPLTLPRSTS